MSAPIRAQVLIVGSGAGGAVTAHELAAQGCDVLVLEEGARRGLDEYGAPSPDAMRRIYRRRGMTPILGPTPIGYVEGCCVGGSTEINSGFWHRTPREILLRWKAQHDLADSSPEDLAPHFEWAERMLGVGLSTNPWPAGTRAFARGIEAMGWSYQEVPRAAPGCKNTNACAHGCPTGAKQGMSRSLLPRAEALGARVLPRCRVKLLLKKRGRVSGVLAALAAEDGAEQLVRIEAEHVFICAGPTETPSLLRRSGIKLHIGETFSIHPMLKVAARFPDELDSARSVLPLLQVKEFWPEISLGGGYFTNGHLAMTLSENWPEAAAAMDDARRMAIFYVAVRGTGKGSVRPAALGDGAAVLRYKLSHDDVGNLSRGLARLSSLLLAGGADAVFPSVHGVPAITSEIAAMRWLDEPLPASRLSLTTVHAFSTCPSGERAGRSAVDSFGRVPGFENLRLNDASILPGSPGVNPQGSVMAFARRNAHHFAAHLAH